MHNRNYWKGIPFWGVGPGAHGFDGVNRYAHVSNNRRYVKSMQQAQSMLDVPVEVDALKTADRFNERIMTGLRNCNWSLDVILELRTGKLGSGRCSKTISYPCPTDNFAFQRIDGCSPMRSPLNSSGSTIDQSVSRRFAALRARRLMPASTKTAPTMITAPA